MKHVPNLLSALRLALAPVLFVLLWRHEYGAALVGVAVAGLADGFDGWVARRFDASSRLGEYLDPLADKVLLSGTFLTLALDGDIDRWLAVLVLGRDAGILLFGSGAFLFTKSLRKFPPSIWGKASTTAQVAFVLVLVAHLAGAPDELLVTLGKWSTVALTVWSGIDYLWRGLSMTRQLARTPADSI